MDMDFIEYNGEKIYFYIKRKKIKNINLRINIDKKIVLSIPMKMPLYKAKNFVKQKVKWIKKQLNFYDKFAEQREIKEFENEEILYLLGKKYKIKLISNKNNNVLINDEYIEIYIKERFIDNKKYIENFYEKWLKQYSLEYFEKIVIRYQNDLKNYGIPFPKIEVRNMKTRWGSCTPTYNKIVFNLNLIKTPIACIEYVVLHELSHFKHQNHSKNFYDFIAIFMPDWKDRRKILNLEYGGVVK